MTQFYDSVNVCFKIHVVELLGLYGSDLAMLCPVQFHLTCPSNA